MVGQEEVPSSRLLLPRLAREGVLVCAACASPSLEFVDEACLCGRCGGRWSARRGVPDFFHGYAQRDVGSSQLRFHPTMSNDEVVELVRRYLHLQDDASVRADVAEILSDAASLRCEDSALGAEVAEVVDRILPQTGSLQRPAPDPASNRDASAEAVLHYLRDEVRAAAPFVANVRLRNTGSFPLSSRGFPPAQLRAVWDHDPKTAVYSSLAVDIKAGGYLTVPMRLIAPALPGEHELRVQLVVGGEVRSELLAHRLRCSELAEETSAVLRETGQAYDYATDHAIGRQMLREALERGGPQRRTLEIGTGPHPQIAGFEDCDVVAVDVSAPLLALGTLCFADRLSHRLGFVCADVMQLPLAPGSLDAIAMFSTLHHFPDPVAALSRLRRLLRPGGLLAVMCEPVGDSLEGRATLRDLLKGINEQVFSVPEYRLVFQRAGLRERAVQVDGGSLKALLEANPG